MLQRKEDDSQLLRYVLFIIYFFIVVYYRIYNSGTSMAGVELMTANWAQTICRVVWAQAFLYYLFLYFILNTI